ncbi:hypothetical protein [Xanthomonas graminis]|uniref:Guanylate cyclase domain-containing protein n=1 Tax=Xanthomonas graminis pv. arrhenatheri LMG 727 TaxID=1195923 RepID=A0A0K3A455_9XANT|nr:hypothetical protein [Xanthomonas translucens]UKE77311.1 hypothetical protein KM317_18150 [Xanthomonas translucens pv. arrhenatheri]CTP90325.1 hypothetical protein XTALMG727_3026 [Xanthomonas translucens pv. arrhenatheri LMG 727]
MPELKQHFVAFLDILGFSQMVEGDADGTNNLAKLYRCHQAAGAIFADDTECSITQFSDSIVVSKPYEASGFKWFAESLAKYQRLLLDEGLLCRGGIAVNTHFSNNAFTFSSGLIDAYRLESTLARFPRVVISADLLDLVFPGGKKMPPYLMREDDGLVFIDYMWVTRNSSPRKMMGMVSELVESMSKSGSASVREKARWLASYSDHVMSSSLSIPRFHDDRPKTAKRK